MFDKYHKMRSDIFLFLLAFYSAKFFVTIAFIKPPVRTKNLKNDSLKIPVPNNMPFIRDQPKHFDSWEDGEIPWTFIDDKDKKNSSDNSTSLRKPVIPPFVPMSPAAIAFLIV
jgi:hypothetical protein